MDQGLQYFRWLGNVMRTVRSFITEACAVESEPRTGPSTELCKTPDKGNKRVVSAIFLYKDVNRSKILSLKFGL